MTGNLMSISIHTLDHGRPIRTSIINGTFAKVDAGDEKGGFHLLIGEHLKDLVRVDVWTVIIRNSHLSRCDARTYAKSTVYLVAQFGTRNVASGSSSREDICVVGGPILEETIWCCAIIVSLTTPTPA